LHITFKTVKTVMRRPVAQRWFERLHFSRKVWVETPTCP